MTRHWMVHVDCWKRAKKHSRWVQMVSKYVVVEADDSDAAFDAAHKHLHLSRANGWLSTIEDRSAHTISLPIVVSTIFRSPMKLASALQPDRG